MTFVSYAQNFEDVVLHRALGEVREGFYVDVGAQDPVLDSVTKAFYERGWRGINIDPVKEWFERLNADRAGDINLQLAVSDEPGSALIHEVVGTGMSTARIDYATKHREAGFEISPVKVPSRSLDSILREYDVQVIHFLKIDVEGAEASVLRSIDLDNTRPWIVLVESTEPNSTTPTHDDWEGLLLDHGYGFAHFDGLNRFYIAREHFDRLRPRLSMPPNYFDDFVRYSDLVARQRSAELESERSRAKIVLEDVSAGLHAVAIDAAGAFAETVAAHGDLAALKSSLTTLADELGRAGVKLSELEERVAGQIQARTELESEAAFARAEVDHLRLDNARLTSFASVAQRDAEATRHQLASIYQSRSWRITAPLRWASFKIRAGSRTSPSARVPRDPILRKLARHSGEVGLRAVRSNSVVRSVVESLLAAAPRTGARFRRFAELRPAPTPSQIGSRGDARPFQSEALLPMRRETSGSAGDEFILYYYVDHTVACPVNTGMQRVTRSLASALVQQGAPLVFVKWSSAIGDLVLVDQADLEHLSMWNGPSLPDRQRTAYPAAGLLTPLPCDTGGGGWLVVPEVTYINFHGTPLNLELLAACTRRSLRSAFIFYDAIPLRRTEFAQSSEPHAQYMQHLLLSDAVLPISHWSQTDLQTFLAELGAQHSTSPQMRMVPLAGESLRHPRSLRRPDQARRLILSVGTIEPRKNQLSLVEAFEAFSATAEGRDWELVLVGNIHAEVADALNAALVRTPRIQHLANISDDELHELYSSCAFTVFASVEEGFGLPILESLWHARACICANFGAMAEVAEGGGCLTVDVGSKKALFGAIRALATDPTLLSNLTEQAAERPLRCWSDYALDVRNFLRDVGRPQQRLGTVYYWIEHTSAFPHNTGIQRVVRGLARALTELGVNLVPVRWNPERRAVFRAGPDELRHLSDWNGPKASAWSERAIPDAFDARDWLLIPELTVYPGGPDLSEVQSYCRAAGLRTAWIFYDAIPWKLKSHYRSDWQFLHAQYMRALNQFELILAISEHSRNDLVQFLRSIRDRTPDLERRVVACVLPGEFMESARVYATKPPGHSMRILSVGSVEPRKNHGVLLEAFGQAREMARRPLELVIAGGCHLPAADAEQFKASVGRGDGITWVDNPDDATLRTLYESCDFTVYPSLEEGFGLPILESLWNARPCICRNRGALAEAALGGGCWTVDTSDTRALGGAIARLADDDELRADLAQQAAERKFRTWADYGRDVISRLAFERNVVVDLDRGEPQAGKPTPFVNLAPRPLLSVCISTYNRAGWLDLTMQNLVRIWPKPRDDVEIVVCDNASSDPTPDIMKEFVGRSDVRYYRNNVNVGMLGNLRVTAHRSRGRFVWILGDDDLLVDGAIEKVLGVLRSAPNLSLVYLNYAYTHENDPAKIADFGQHLTSGIPIVPAGADEQAAIRVLATKSENFFTAIYCLVFRRDHALHAYSQDTSGRPFSTMLTAIPTTYYVLEHMMGAAGYWIGEPLVVVNMNVSWMKYAPLWVLERLPEVFDRAEHLGADPEAVDYWRVHNLPGVMHYFGEIMAQDHAGNRQFFSPSRMVSRFKHLREFEVQVVAMRSIYEQARASGVPGTELPADQVFSAFTHDTEVAASA